MFTLPELPYAYNALEPYIDEKTMQIHHDKHHAAYIEKLNAALEDLPELLSMPIIEVLKDIHTLVPEAQRQAVINHGGGHANHTFFWEIMCPNSKKVPEGPLYEAITNTFDSFEKFKEAFALAGVGRFGSGWAWLVLNKGALEITSTANQDSPLMQGMVPLLGLDVWEHAYYLHYQNRRPEYIEAWWNVVHWEKVEELYTNAV